MDFIIYDIILLIFFVLFISLFLYTRKKNLKKEGLLFLYKTSWGIKLINYVGNKYKRTLKVLSYISIGLGYCLMAAMFYLFYTIIKIYLFRPDIVSTIKVPPIMPLIPYIDKIVPGLPSFYFTYWIIILAVIAITHEFAHGIFAVYNKVKVKTTGFGFFPFFLPIFLAAFVELDEEKMTKKNKFSQMSILSAGTFANVLTAIFFFGVMWFFFSFAFAPSGIVFDNYAYSIVEITSISSINGILLDNVSYEKFLNLANETGLNEIEAKGNSYVATKDFLEKQKSNEEYVILYFNAPAINAGLSNIITEINGVKINDWEKLSEELLKHSSGEEITIIGDESKEYKITIGEHPNDENLPWLGIGFEDYKQSSIMGKIYNLFSSFKKPHVYYEPKFDGISLFVYNLFWWLILISISVALINMLPVGIFDGGRFFYLTALAITNNEKKSKRIFSFLTYFFLFLLFLLMVFWIFSFIK
jgi:membrane-associated protease RseP (regulator of RpoE activity)